MGSIRSLTCSETMTRSVLRGFAVTFLLIVGLLAMHTISTGASHPESGSSAVAVGHGNPAIIGAEGAVSGAAHCPGGCDAPGDMPDHSSMLMVCALALLATAIVVLAPALLGRLAMPLSVRGLVLTTARAVPEPRPPSLLVLSISRT